MTEHRALIEKAYEDFARGDVPAVLAVLADDVRWSEAEGNPWWQGGPAVGPQQLVEQVIARIPAEYDDFAIEVERIVGLGDTVLMQGRYTGTGRATGRRLDAQVAHVWDLRDGKVVRFQQYTDTGQWQQVLGTQDSRVTVAAG